LLGAVAGGVTLPFAPTESGEGPAQAKTVVEASSRGKMDEATNRMSGWGQGPPSDQVELAGYEILRELGRGGMGVVYLARQVSLNRAVALKMVLAGAQARGDELARFRIEAEAAAKLQHPNLVQIYEVGEYQGRPYFSLEYVEGGNLDDRFGGQPQPPISAAALVEKLARAMHYAHQRGIVHRDLKPANVLLTLAGEPKITDFGLAKQLGSEAGLTHTGAVMGTPSYMAPEQAEARHAEVGPATDVYALGAMLYEFLTGWPPFIAETSWGTIERLLREEPVPPRRLQPNVPRDLEIICLKCLEKDPRRRYTTAEELADDLQRFREGEPIRARPAPVWERAWKWVRKRPALAAAFAVGAILAFGLVAALVIHDVQTQAINEANRERLVRLMVANGVRYQNEGDWFDALLWFAEALRLDPGTLESEEMHRRRLGSLLYECPRLTKFWIHDSAVRHATFSEDGRLVATAGDDAIARVLNLRDGSDATPPLPHESPVRLVSFRPDASLLATVSHQGLLRIWEVPEGRLRGEPISAPAGKIRDIAWRPDGERLAAACDDGKVRIWNVRSMRAIEAPLDHGDPVSAVAYSANGRWLASRGGSSVRLWHADSHQSAAPAWHHDAPIRFFAFDAQSRHFASADQRGADPPVGSASPRTASQ
jgi:predicted Ser/Thr protein kinase